MRIVGLGGWRAIRLAAWFWLLGWLAAHAATPEPFFVYADPEQTGDGGVVTNLVWVAGTNWFRLAPVPNWRARANGTGRRLELLESDGTAAMLLRYQSREGKVAPEDVSALGLERHPGFRLMREFDLGSGCGRARVLDLVMSQEGEDVVPSTAVRRVALVPMEDGFLECTLSTSWRWLEGLDAVFSRLLVSVRRVEPPPTWEWTGE